MPQKGGVKPQSQTAGNGKGLKKGESKMQSTSEQTGKEKAPHPNQKQNKHSGFQTKPEVEHVDLENGKKRKKVLAFPSHRGPKIRMRDKGKQKAPQAKKAKPGSSRKERQRLMEKPTQPRNQKVKTSKKTYKSRDGDRFDSLVEKYRKKLTGSGDKNTVMKRSKWFDN